MLPATRSTISPRISEVLARLTESEHETFVAWKDAVRLFQELGGGAAAVAVVLRRFAGVPGMSRSGLYRKAAAYAKSGDIALLPMAATRRPAIGRATTLPPEFVAHWQGICGMHQREKVLAAWRYLIRELMSGSIIPGYGCDWRGIWAAEHPGMQIPAACPYRSATGAAPKGWSYRNLRDLAPEKDVWHGAARGVQAMRSHLPSVPHTRVGLKFGSVFFVDDVWHDFKVFVGQKEAQRPVELGMMEALTGRYATWGLCAVTRAEDGARKMLRGVYMRYLLCDLLCNVGVSPDGITIFAEHGTANLSDKLLTRLNDAICAYCGKPDFVKVSLGKTYGEPAAVGLFQERPRGNPRWKAMLESSWNLLHNETAILPGQVGRNRDESPADVAGRDKETSALATIAMEIAKNNADIAGRYLTGYLSFSDAYQYVQSIKRMIETRTDHRLEGWVDCGFVRHVASVAGADIDLDAIAAERPEAVDDIRKIIDMTSAPVREERLSPLAAWTKCAKKEGALIKFPAAVSASILFDDPECTRLATVSERGTISFRDTSGAPKEYVFNAIITDASGHQISLPRGSKWRVAFNPFSRDDLLVSNEDGRFIGSTGRPYQAAVYGDRDGDLKNLALYKQAMEEQRRRFSPLADAQFSRRANATRAAIESLVSAGVGIQADSNDDLPADDGDSAAAFLDSISSDL